MSTLLAKIQIHAGQEQEFEEVMAYMYRQTHDTEDGVLRYEYWRGSEPNFYYCLLSFKDAPTFGDIRPAITTREKWPGLLAVSRISILRSLTRCNRPRLCRQQRRE